MPQTGFMHKERLRILLRSPCHIFNIFYKSVVMPALFLPSVPASVACLTASLAVSSQGRHTWGSTYRKLLPRGRSPVRWVHFANVVSSLLYATLLLSSEMFNGTPQSSGLVEHPLVPVFTNRQAETDLSNLLIT